MFPVLYVALLTAPASATVASSLPTSGGQIRQFAFDGDAKTYFASAGNAKADDNLTLTFDRVVNVTSVGVTTGRPAGEDVLTAGVLEVSADGKAFESAAAVENGEAKADGPRAVRAVRVRVTKDQDRPLVVRELRVDAALPVPPFRYPVEFSIDVADAPDLKPWMENVVRVCEQQYPMICRELASDGYKPPTQIRMALRSDYTGVAEASGNRIRGSVKFFKEHPDDIGAFVHETAHTVQGYRSRRNPGWLVEGIADYVRFWKYEPGKAGRLNPERVRYSDSYRTTAAFLAYVSNRYDYKLVTKLNAVMREGKYEKSVWKQLTTKTVEELDQEWRESLVRNRR